MNDINMLVSMTRQVEEKRDISFIELSAMLAEIEVEMKIVEDRNKIDARGQEIQQREREWERDEQEERDLCIKRGVYIVYNDPLVYTYQPTSTGGRIVISVRGRYHGKCAVCGDSSAKLRGGVCKVCDLGLLTTTLYILEQEKNEI